MNRPSLVTEMKAILGEDAEADVAKLVGTLADAAYEQAAKWKLLPFGVQKLSVEKVKKGVSMLAMKGDGEGKPVPFWVTVEMFDGPPHYLLTNSDHKNLKLPLDTPVKQVLSKLWAMQTKVFKGMGESTDLDEEEEPATASALPADGKLPSGDVSDEDKRAMLGIFNTKLAKLMQGLKKGADAETIKGNYKGTGKQAFRRQLWVRFKNGAVIDLWLENGRLEFGGVVARSNSGGQPKPSPIPYKDRTPEDVFDLALKAIKAWNV